LIFGFSFFRCRLTFGGEGLAATASVAEEAMLAAAGHSDALPLTLPLLLLE
jgi:hypothetical protein